MINDIDSWKTELDSNGFARKKFDLVDHADFDEDKTLMRMKNSSSSSDIRYINPAIYSKSISEEEPEGDCKQGGCQIQIKKSREIRFFKKIFFEFRLKFFERLK